MEMYTDKALHPITLPILERENYGVTHTGIGVLLAKKWGLSNNICNAIYLHHHLYATYRREIGSEDVTLAAVLKLAEYFGSKNLMLLDVNSSVENGLLFNNAIEELMLEDQTLDRIEEDVNALM